MERIEYRNIHHKADWRRGPWDNEPDKVQWQDEATGLPCLIVRGPSGALCGYVGVAPNHPLHGKDYDTDLADLCAHGGLTFAGGCTHATKEAWENLRARKPELEREAKKYPIGDSARALKDWAECFDNFDKYAERVQASHICHIPGPGQPDNVWWFGFDCAHSGDLCPSHSRLGLRDITGDTYKDIAYVTAEVQALAKQLVRLA